MEVGNLLLDPAAQSFISREDADAYLSIEAAGRVSDWLLSGVMAQEASLAGASRWMADTLSWCRRDLDEADMIRVGRAAARLAVTATEFWAPEAIGKTAKRYKAGSVEVEYQGGLVLGAKAAGQAFPWLYPMLDGLVCSGSTRWIARA